MSPGGAVNVVPNRSIPLVTALHLGTKIPVSIPHPVAYATSELLWSSGLGDAPGGFVDYVRYPFVADGEKARRVLGFEARHASRDALVAYLAVPLSRTPRWAPRRPRHERRARRSCPSCRGRAAAGTTRRTSSASASTRLEEELERHAGRPAREESGREGLLVALARMLQAGAGAASPGRTWRGPGAPSTSPGTPRSVDDFGYDRKFTKTILPLFEFLYTMWWRVGAAGGRERSRGGPGR